MDEILYSHVPFVSFIMRNIVFIMVKVTGIFVLYKRLLIGKVGEFRI